MRKVPDPIHTARCVAAGQAPLSPAEWDQVVLGKAMRAAIEAGFVRIDNGSNPDWGCYTITPAGLAAIAGEA